MRAVQGSSPTADVLRIVGAWRDVALYSDLHAEWVAEAGTRLPRDWWKTSPSQQQAELSFILGFRIDAMLRAAIVFGDVFNSVLLQEVLGLHTVDVHLGQLMSASRPNLRSWLASLNPEALLAAYALRQYRNKLVVHFEVARMESASFRMEDWSTRRLWPIIWSHQPEKLPHHDELQDLAQRYASRPRIAALTTIDAEGRHNYWELLEALFYEVPPLVRGLPNPERTLVDKAASRGGVKSFTMAELLEIEDAFVRAVVSRHLAVGAPEPD